MKYKLKEVFTPTIPARLTFVSRESVQKNLERAIMQPGKQLVIYGPSGAGKTTIIKNMFEELKIPSVTTSCKNNMTLSNLIIELIRKLQIPIIDNQEVVNGGEFGGDISISLFGFGAKTNSKLLDTKKTTYKNIDYGTSIHALIDELGKRNICWIIEDFHKIEESEKKEFSQIMKMFMDSADLYPEIKIISIGAVNTAREVINYDSELNNRVAEIQVPLLTNSELQSIIVKGCKLLNIYFTQKSIEKIVTYSNGLPSVTHSLCYNSCIDLRIYSTVLGDVEKQIPDSTLNDAIHSYIEEKSDSYKKVYELATKVYKQRKHDNPVDIINAFLELKINDGVTVNDIKRHINKKFSSYKGQNLKSYIHELTSKDRGEIFRYNKDSDRYFFHNPFIQAYAYCIKDKLGDTDLILDKSKMVKELEATLREELLTAKNQFLEDFDEEFEIY